MPYEPHRMLIGRSGQRGMTLMEVVIVALIVAVLVSIALPGFRQQFIEMRRVTATMELRKLVAMQEEFRQRYRRYATDLAELGFGAARYGLDPQGNVVSATDSDSVYLITLTSEGDQLVVQASPQNSQAADLKCGTLVLTLRGIPGKSGRGALSDCW